MIADSFVQATRRVDLLAAIRVLRGVTTDRFGEHSSCADEAEHPHRPLTASVAPWRETVIWVCSVPPGIPADRAFCRREPVRRGGELSAGVATSL